MSWLQGVDRGEVEHLGAQGRHGKGGCEYGSLHPQAPIDQLPKMHILHLWQLINLLLEDFPTPRRKPTKFYFLRPFSRTLDPHHPLGNEFELPFGGIRVVVVSGS